MRIINVIETKNNSVHSITSFGIYEDQLSEDVKEKAEDFFITVAKENGLLINEETDITDVAYDTIETGYFENGSYMVSLVWSEV